MDAKFWPILFWNVCLNQFNRDWINESAPIEVGYLATYFGHRSVIVFPDPNPTS